MKNKVFDAYNNGKINKYMQNKVLDAADDGMTEDLLEELLEDATIASSCGVDNDQDYCIYFFINQFADDMLDDTFGLKISPEEKLDLYCYLFGHRKDGDYKFDNLVDYRILIHKWLCDRISKKAYPNISGKYDHEPVQDLDKWISTLKSIYNTLHNDSKIKRQDVIDYFTLGWDSDEKYKFLNWMRYYEQGNAEKYNVKNAKFNRYANEISLPQSWLSRDNRADDGMQMSTYKKTKREKELEQAKLFKTQMRSRLRSFKKLVDRYSDILPKQNLEHIYDEVHRLEKSVSRLNVYASIQDCIIRSANRIKKFGFHEGADVLRKFAEANDQVIQSLPVGESDEPDLPKGPSKTSIMMIINRLEGVSKLLKARDMIRELASIDILLNDLGMASLFPELTDAQSKLIESFGYASNKVEGIIAKLRGTGISSPSTPVAQPKEQAQPQQPAQVKPVPAPESIDTGEMLTKPVEKVQRQLPKKIEKAK